MHSHELHKVALLTSLAEKGKNAQDAMYLQCSVDGDITFVAEMNCCRI